MLTKGVIQLDKKCDSSSVNMVAFRSFKPTNIEPFMLKKVEFRLMNKVENEDGLILVAMVSREEIRVHPDLINDESWETMKSRPTSKERREAKKSLRNSQQAVKAQFIKEAKKEVEPVHKEKILVESSKSMRKPITLPDFLLLVIEEEDELQLSNYNQVSRVGRASLSDSDDSKYGDWIPPLMPPPMDGDDDYQGSDQESDLDEEEYVSDEVLDGNYFIIDSFFYQENIPEREVQIYNPRLLEPGDWPIDPPLFPLPLEIHPDPLPTMDDSEPCR